MDSSSLGNLFFYVENIPLCLQVGDQMSHPDGECEGILIGKLDVHTKTTRTDDEDRVKLTTRTLCVKAFRPGSVPFGLQMDGEASDSKNEDKCAIFKSWLAEDEEVIGWYRFRQGQELTPNITDYVIHRKFQQLNAPFITIDPNLLMFMLFTARVEETESLKMSNTAFLLDGRKFVALETTMFSKGEGSSLGQYKDASPYFGHELEDYAKMDRKPFEAAVAETVKTFDSLMSRTIEKIEDLSFQEERVQKMAPGAGAASGDSTHGASTSGNGTPGDSNPGFRVFLDSHGNPVEIRTEMLRLPATSSRTRLDQFLIPVPMSPHKARKERAQSPGRVSPRKVKKEPRPSSEEIGSPHRAEVSPRKVKKESRPSTDEVGSPHQAEVSPRKVKKESRPSTDEVGSPSKVEVSPHMVKKKPRPSTEEIGSPPQAQVSPRKVKKESRPSTEEVFSPSQAQVSPHIAKKKPRPSTEETGSPLHPVVSSPGSTRSPARQTRSSSSISGDEESDLFRSPVVRVAGPGPSSPKEVKEPGGSDLEGDEPGAPAEPPAAGRYALRDKASVKRIIPQQSEGSPAQDPKPKKGRGRKRK